MSFKMAMAKQLLAPKVVQVQNGHGWATFDFENSLVGANKQINNLNSSRI